MVDQDGLRLTTIEKAFQIIETIMQMDGARVTPLAKRLELAPSTVHNHLRTLTHLEYLVKEGDEYHVGLQFLDLGGYASQRRPGMRFIKDKAAELADETGERVQFIAEEYGYGIYLTTMTGENAVQVDARVGKRTHLHASAAGKTILANLPPERLDAYLDTHDLPQLTENTITTQDELREELSTIKETGVGFNREESIEGLHAIGAVIKDRENDGVLGAMSISGPTNRLKGDRFKEELPQLLLGTTNELELKIEFS